MLPVVAFTVNLLVLSVMFAPEPPAIPPLSVARPVAVKVPATSVLPVEAATVNLLVLIVISEDAPPVSVPTKVVFPVTVKPAPTFTAPAVKIDQAFVRVTLVPAAGAPKNALA